MMRGKGNIFSGWFHFSNLPRELMEPQSLEIFKNSSGHGPVQLTISSKVPLLWAWDGPVLQVCFPTQINNDMMKFCSPLLP